LGNILGQRIVFVHSHGGKTLHTIYVCPSFMIAWWGQLDRLSHTIRNDENIGATVL